MIIDTQVLKAARRQAYRYGRQLALMSANTHAFVDAQTAWGAFIAQFKALESADMIINYLITAYKIGVDGNLSTDEAIGFTIAGVDHDWY